MGLGLYLQPGHKVRGPSVLFLTGLGKCPTPGRVRQVLSKGVVQGG